MRRALASALLASLVACVHSRPEPELRVAPPTPDSPVEWDAALAPEIVAPGGTTVLVVGARIAPSWFIAPLRSRGLPRATEIELDLPDGLTVIGEWERSEPRADPASGRSAYFESATFRLELRADEKAEGTQPISITIVHQPCNPDACLPVERMHRTLTVEVVE